MSSISLCMITKDEQSLIDQAIRSVLPIVSQIVVVDTGSSDKTIEIVQHLGAQVYSVPWNNDFAAARNISLQHAICDWILVLDADEAIAERDLNELVTLSEDPTCCIEFTQRHYTDDHRLSDFHVVCGEYPEWERQHGGYFESSLVRMFPNRSGIEYQGKVHELVEHSIRKIGKHRIIRARARIQHYGHTAAVRAAKNKSQLYTPLGQAKVEEAPLQWKNCFELGIEYNNNGKLQESESALLEAARLNPDYLPTWTNLGYVQCELQRYNEAKASLQTAIKLDPKSAEAYCNLGVVYLRLADFKRSEQCFRNALFISPKYINARCNLGTCLACMNRFSEAVNIFQSVLDIYPSCTKAHSSLGALYQGANLNELAEKHLRLAGEQ